VPDAVFPRYTVSTVARRLGVAPATLRTWARRYDLGPTAHTSGSHRRYSDADLARLERMRRLTVEGVAPAEAARLARAASVPAQPERAAPVAEAVAGRSGGPGGRVLALPGADPEVRGLARAAMALDAETVTEQLRTAFSAGGVIPTWHALVGPVLVSVGQRWASTGKGVEVEHLLSECTVAALREVVLTASPPRSPRPALLACVEGDQHSLPLHALAAALAEQGVATRVLGPSVPPDALAAAVRRTGPAAIFLWSQVPATAQPGALDGLPVTRPAAMLVTGGPGWRGRVPATARHADDLPSAVALVASASAGTASEPGVAAPTEGG
jgi:MerR family transcriptional regulator, light-induced transcriptional regulator